MATWKIPAAVKDRRTEHRFPASGPATLFVYNELEMVAEVRCELVDQSGSGCKLRHNYGHLDTGEMVALKFGSVETRAIAVWTRQVEGHFESGFSFLS